MAAPARPFVVNPVLTGYAIGYSNPDLTLIADQVLPRVPVAGESFKWLEYPLAEGFSLPDTKVGRKGRVPLVEFSAIEQNGAVDSYGLGDVILNSDIKAAEAQRRAGISSYDPRAHAVNWLTNLLMLDREVRVAAMMQNTANYAPARITALTGTARFEDYANSDPIGVINAALDSTLIYRPNTVTMGFAVWQKLRSHPKLVKAIANSYSGEGMITRKQFADFFEIKNLFVGEGWVNTARKGQAASLQRVWGKHISLTYIDRAARPDGGVTWGLSPQFGERIAGSVMDSDVGLEGGEEIRVGEKITELVMAKDAGALITNAVS
ncbi:major capsid protein [Methylocystis sp. WRRC1]|uniref:major capsid protein n=1 Tax=Methylocystis sp. WRRC1 TaxID=1732014 RepID=UPI001D142A24|nr:major capsid protein [Methylocystis sp. WRRC1]MCC3246145.1 major capsid protein [Methylocystis sp. WRRC1]